MPGCFVPTRRTSSARKADLGARSLAVLTGELQRASHRSGKCLRNGQPQARPLVEAALGAVHLREWLEDDAEELRGNTNARVFHDDARLRTLLCEIRSQHRDGNSTTRRELHRVAHQLVEQP